MLYTQNINKLFYFYKQMHFLGEGLDKKTELILAILQKID